MRYAFDHPNFQNTLNSEVEVDEMFIGGEAKNKHSNKKNKNERGGTLHEKQPVLGMKERGGNVVAKVVPNRNKETILPIVHRTVENDSKVYTDEYTAYKDLRYNYEHQKVNHGAKEYVNQMAHTNGIENFWSHLKRGIDGIYHWVSKYHLQSYIDEFTLRFNTRKFDTQSRFDLILAAVAGKKLTYNDLIN